MVAFSLHTPLDRLPLAFLDVETTGLTPEVGDRVCEIAIAQTRAEAVEDTWSSLVNPERPISPGAFAVNQIRDRDVRGAPFFAELADKVQLRLDGRVIVCHNAPFDLGFMRSELGRIGRRLQALTVIDTLQIARRCFRFRSNSLSSVAESLGIATPRAHRALSDALTTHAVFLEFAESLKARGVQTLEDLLRVQDGAVATGGAASVPLPPQVEEALQNGKRLFLVYLDARGNKSERWVTPEEVIGDGPDLTLVAFCHLRLERRQFRLDRIVTMTIES